MYTLQLVKKPCYLTPIWNLKICTENPSIPSKNQTRRPIPRSVQIAPCMLKFIYHQPVCNVRNEVPLSTPYPVSGELDVNVSDNVHK